MSSSSSPAKIVTDNPVVVNFKLDKNVIQITILTLTLNKPLKNCHLKLTLDNYSYRTSSHKQKSEIKWNECFQFQVPLHSQLFSELVIELYENKFIDYLVGKFELRISCLFGINGFKSFYELFNVDESVGVLEMKVDFEGLDGENYLSLFSDINDTSDLLECNASDISDNEGSVAAEMLNSSDNLNEMEYEIMHESVDYLAKEDNSIFDSIGNLLLSKETNKTIKAIRKIVSSLNLPHSIMLSSLIKLETFYSNIHTQKTGLKVKQLGILERARHFYKYSMASYGWKGLTFFGKRPMKDLNDRKALLEYLSLPPECLIVFQEASLFQPSYFIALDGFTDSLVLVLRGTMSTYDALTDLVCEYHPFLNGLGHIGIINSAYWFYNNIYGQLIENFTKFKPTNLVICGHSLGGAVASALTMIINKKHPNESYQLKCYSFASPPFVSRNLCKKYEDLIYNYIVEDDGVCRLSYGHVTDLKQLILAAIGDPKGNYNRKLSEENLNEEAINLSENSKWWNIQTLFKSNNTKKDFGDIVLLDMIKNCRDRLKNPSDTRLRNIKLYIPGTIYFMYYADENKKPFSSLLPNAVKTKKVKEKKKVYMEVSKAEYFEEMLIRRTMFLHHIPNVYDKAFERAWETLMTELAEEQGLSISSSSVVVENKSRSNNEATNS